MFKLNEFTKGQLEELKDKENISKCVMETSKDDRQVVRINKDGKWVYIGSKYSVKRDIEKLINSVKEHNDFTTFLIFGIGSGEHVKEFANKFPRNRIIVVEPEEEIFRNCIHNFKGINDIINQDRITLCVYDEGSINEILSQIEEYNINNLFFGIYGNYGQIYKEEKEALILKLHNFIELNEINVNNNKYNGLQYFRCYINNLNCLYKSISINLLKNIYKNKTAVIVSAGPSLDKNIKALKGREENAIVICSVRTLKPLIQNGIKPDFICAIDQGDIMYGMAKEYFDLDVPIVYYEYTNFNFINHYLGPKVFFTAEYIKKSTEKLTGMDVDSLAQGGSVAHTALELSAYFGCSTVIFIGQDLAYTDNKFHSDSSKLEDESYNLKINEILVEGINGDNVKTNYMLNKFRLFLEEQISEYKNVKFINATEGGAKIKGTQTEKLKEALNNYGKEKIEKVNIDKLEVLGSKCRENINIRVKISLKILEEILKQCNEIIILCSKLLKNKMHNNFLQNSSEYMHFLNLSEKININYDKVDFIGDITHTAIEKFLTENNKVLNMNLSENNKKTIIIKESLELYSEIKDGVTFAINEIKNCGKNFNL